ncbi:MAG: S-methyl-5-thioribose-1-phosphate isomerase [Candidatus Ratteibacteria bacterium]
MKSKSFDLFSRTFPTVTWKGTFLEIIDQSLLPERFTFLHLYSIEEVWDAIHTLKVRGAPAIGIAGAFGMVLTAHTKKEFSLEDFFSAMKEAAIYIKKCRPTAVNLRYGVDRVYDRAFSMKESRISDILFAMEEEAMMIFEEDLSACRKIGEYGDTLICSGMNILTHCNAGGLATSGEGTALSPLFYAARTGKKIHVYVDETRPVLQGSRLTAWELSRVGIPYTLICDNMAGFLMQKNLVDMVITGADRICANGDTANKIGTYALAVLARAHKIPFYIAAPRSTLDSSLSDGSLIPIEERSRNELLYIGNQIIAPKNAPVWNPAFDITPGDFITAFITEEGIFSRESLLL